jgi:hypothetical protein
LPSGYGIFEKTDIKKCLDNINLKPLRIVSIPIAKAITLNQNENDNENTDENKPNGAKNDQSDDKDSSTDTKGILKVLIDMNSGI